jgi:hypothetical protein
MLPAEAVDVRMPASVSVPRARVEPRRFYVWMAYACAFIAFAGFTPTYWAPVAGGTFAAPPVVHFHGLVFFAWTLLFVAQARFAASGRRAPHRALGLAGISLATLLVVAGIMVAVASMEAGIARGTGDHARAFTIVPITIVLTFAVLFAAALANTRRPDVLMRLMLTAAIAVLPPAFARLVRTLIGAAAPAGLGNTPPLMATLVPAALSDLLLVGAIVYDWRTRGRPHRVYVVALAAIVVVQVVRIPLATSGAWTAVTEWLLGFTAR